MVTVVLVTAVAIVTEAAPLQRKQLLNDQWQFVENDSDFTKAQSVILPHDWSVYHRFDVNAPAGNDGAYLATGKGWYRRTLTLGKAYAGKKTVSMSMGTRLVGGLMATPRSGWMLHLILI